LEASTESDPRPRGAFITRVATLLGIAAEGAALALAVAALGILCLLIGLVWTGVVLLALAATTGGFFRDPDRTAVTAGDVVLSGADGRVTDIAEEELPGMADGARYRRVSVFMSLLNVHVNRAPVGGDVVAIKYMPGQFRAAFRDHASLYNERNLIVLTDRAARRHAMVQVAGYVARRIVCRLRPHDTVASGQRVGLIMFGSRVDHFMPLDYRVTVRVGDRVRGGESVIGELLR
jgi:phosphatidylserine decarboxylase